MIPPNFPASFKVTNRVRKKKAPEGAFCCYFYLYLERVLYAERDGGHIRAPRNST